MEGTVPALVYRARPPWSWLALVISVYSSSFFLPAYQDGERNPVLSGCEVFACTLHGGGEYFPSCLILWLPNPIFWAGLCFLALRNRPDAGVMGSLAVVMAALDGHFDGHSLRGNESLKPGYYVWLLSMVLLVAASIFTHGSVAQHPRPARGSP
jgi:hypothetical protein